MVGLRRARAWLACAAVVVACRHQKTWLLYSILPKKVVQTLRRGGEWSQKHDCCVLFADGERGAPRCPL